MKDLEALQNFIPAFVQFEKSALSGFVAFETKFLGRFLQKYDPVWRRYEQQKQVLASDYNVFRIIRYGHYETRLHTPLLSDLLSPSGLHGQGRLFFDQFLNNVYKDEFDQAHISNITVTEELYAEEMGRIDIYIEFVYQRNMCRIVLENKINHFDTKDQLENYRQYLLDYTRTGDVYKILFLTKYGQPPNLNHSIALDIYNKLARENKIKLLSYTRDIARWLDESIIKIKAPVLKQTLLQYLQIIKAF